MLIVPDWSKKAAHSATAFALVCGLAHAQDESMVDAATRLRAQHASIATQDDAQAALDDVKRARARIDWLHYDRAVDCRSKFFSTSCTSQALAQQRAALKQVRVVELEAEQTIRTLRDQERQARRDQAQARSDADAKALEAVRDKKLGDSQRRVEERDRRVDEVEQKAGERAEQAERERARRTQRAADKSKVQRDADERAAQIGQNVEAYDAKQDEARERQNEMAERRRKRDGKAAKNNGKPSSEQGPLGMPAGK